MAEKLVFMVTHGPEHPEHVTIPFVMAVAALASDVEAVIGLQADAVEIAVRATSTSPILVLRGYPNGTFHSDQEAGATPAPAWRPTSTRTS